MKKYLKYHIGCPAIFTEGDRSITSNISYEWLNHTLKDEITVKPILHRICDMDNMTAKELIRLRGWSESFVDEINFIRVERDQACFYKGCSLKAEVFFEHLSPTQFECLLGGNFHGKFFDIWNLIDAGDAIDVKTLSE